MDFNALIVLLAGKYPIVMLIAMALGALVVFGQAIVVLTPTKKDDEAWEKIKSIPLVGQIVAALANFAPIQKK